jgi:hypothetical protein
MQRGGNFDTDGKRPFLGPMQCLTIFWVKILKFFDADPGSLDPGTEMEKFESGILEKNPGSLTMCKTHTSVQERLCIQRRLIYIPNSST